jgi:hypothetical protein
MEESGQLHTSIVLHPIPIEKEAGCDPEPFQNFGGEEILFLLPRFNPGSSSP